jgi:hypothetical protein
MNRVNKETVIDASESLGASRIPSKSPAAGHHASGARCYHDAQKHAVSGLVRAVLWRVRRISGVVGAIVLLLTAGVGLAEAEAAVAQAAAQQAPSARDYHSRCNNISGSNLCLLWQRNANDKGFLQIAYSKQSGPRRYIRLYVAQCGHAKRQVYAGSIEPGHVRSGTWHGSISPGSCWVGYMRIGNTQWTTGELRS